MRKILTGFLTLGLILALVSVASWNVFVPPEIEEVEILQEAKVEIKGPGDAIFNLEIDGYWWSGRTVEKWIEVKNIGNLPFDFYLTSRGQDFPVFDDKGDGNNVSLQVSWPEWEDIDGDDHGKWHIKPGSFQRILLQVRLPSEADNTVQADRWELTFTFHAAQH